MFQTGGFLL